MLEESCALGGIRNEAAAGLQAQHPYTDTVTVIIMEIESEIGDLAHYLVNQLNSIQVLGGTAHPEPRRLLVGISGIPASGKTTFAQFLTERINHILNQPRSESTTTQDIQADVERPQAILVGLDGWHLTRAQLDVFPDPQTAHDRRGSHWTFDGAGYVSFVRALRDITIGTAVITAPSFDHALKDPTPNAVSIYPSHRIVIIEGLYVFLAIKPWNEGGLLLDERWFIQIDSVEARRRLVKRHVLTGVAQNLKEAEWRADENDGLSTCCHPHLLSSAFLSYFSLNVI